MDAVGAKDIDAFVLKAHGQAEAALAGLGLSEERAAACRAALGSGGDPREAAGDAFAAWVSAARVLNSAVYAERAVHDPRYSADENATPPKKIGSSLVLFDCLTCDKCIPVCPNDANFSFSIPVGETPVELLTRTDGGLGGGSRRLGQGQKAAPDRRLRRRLQRMRPLRRALPRGRRPLQDKAAVLRQPRRLGSVRPRRLRRRAGRARRHHARPLRRRDRCASNGTTGACASAARVSTWLSTRPTSPAASAARPTDRST